MKTEPLPNYYDMDFMNAVACILASKKSYTHKKMSELILKEIERFTKMRKSAVEWLKKQDLHDDVINGNVDVAFKKDKFLVDFERVVIIKEKDFKKAFEDVVKKGSGE